MKQQLENLLTTGKKAIQRTKDFVYTDLYYTLGYSCLVGAGNGVASAQNGKRFDHAFGEGFVNNFGIGLLVNAAYPMVFQATEKSKNFRTYAHLTTAALAVGFLAWHYFAGTENPLAAVLPTYVLGTAMTEQQVAERKMKQRPQQEMR